MIPFSYQRADSPDAAIRLGEKLGAGTNHGAKFLGGGSNLVDLMKGGVELPTTLIDVNHIGLDKMEASASGATIGASVRNADLANHPGIVEHYPLLSQTILAGASPQLRNMATTAGNVMQRTRCYYFTDIAFPACNKRKPGSGCGAVVGVNRIHAILGQTDQGPTSPHTCIATNPSDMSVALYALNAQVEIQGPKGKRTLPVREFHRLVGDNPTLDTNLHSDELITAVTLPANSANFAKNSWYLKARDRQSYAFALVSVAAALELEGNTIRSAGLALGGVAHKPWVSPEAEHALIGKPASDATFNQAATLAIAGAHGYKDNTFKIQLAKQCIVRALSLAVTAQATKGVTS